MTLDFDAHVRSGLDLGNDHYAHREFRTPEGQIVGYPADHGPPEGSVFIGIHEHHKKPDGSWCGGWVGFINVDDPVDDYHRQRSKHELVQEDPLTVAPSLQCRICPSHGFIENGRWRNA